MTALQVSNEQQEIVDILSQKQESGRDNIYDVVISASGKVLKIISNTYKELSQRKGFYANATGTSCSVYSNEKNLQERLSDYLSGVKEFLASRELPHDIEALKQRIFEETGLNADIFDFQEVSTSIVESIVGKAKQTTNVASYEMSFKKRLTKKEIEDAVDNALEFQLVPGGENGEGELLITKEEFISMLKEIFGKIDN